MGAIRKGQKIPAVAITSLVFGGGGVHSSPLAVADDYCRAMQTCDSEYFEYYFNSINECREVQSEYFEETRSYYTGYSGARCASAILEMYSCFYQALAADCESYDEMACAVYEERMDQACD
jgi:hypothetical protein